MRAQGEVTKRVLAARPAESEVEVEVSVAYNRFEPAEISVEAPLVEQMVRSVERVTGSPGEVYGAPFSSDVRNLVNDAGIVTCLEAKTAKTVWQKRIKGEYRASPIYAGGRIYFSSMKGDITVIAADSEFKLLGESKLGPGFQASPAAIGKSLYLRSLTSLYCLE